MKKRVLAVLIAATMLFSLTGCAGDAPAATTGNETVDQEMAVSTTTPTPEPTAEPTVEPTATPTVEPTAIPTVEPTAEPIAEPTAEPTVAPEAEPAKTEVVLGEYKNLVLNAIPQEQVDAKIAEEMSAYAEYVPVDRAAAEGDTVNINYVGTLNGVAFAGGTDDSEEGYDLTLGSGAFIEGFEEGLVGAVAGEVRDLNLTFPENYQSEELAGQSVVFTVTVNAVCKYVVPELTDEFAQTVFEVESAAEIKAAAYELLNEEYLLSQAMQQMVDGSELVSYSETELEEEAQYLIQYYVYNAEYYSSYFGADTETMLAYLFGFESMEALTEYAYAYAYQTIKQSAVLNAIAENEKIELTEEEYTEALNEYALDNGYTDLESFVADYGEEYIREVALFDKVLAVVLEMATVIPIE